MSKSKEGAVDRVLTHRLNGQILKGLERHMDAILGKAWKPQEWIINVILLDRNTEDVYTARLETSATLYEGDLFDGQEKQDPAKVGPFDPAKVAKVGPFDPARVGAFDLPVPLNRSFSGYCIQTGNVVWVNDLDEIRDFHPLYAYYRRFEFVAVRPQASPKAEYVFPLFVRLGLIQSLLGVLNMEFFPPKSDTPSPLLNHDPLVVSEPIMKLLSTHGPFLQVASLAEVSRITIQEGSFFSSTLLDLHRQVVEERVNTFRREFDMRISSPHMQSDSKHQAEPQTPAVGTPAVGTPAVGTPAVGTPVSQQGGVEAKGGDLENGYGNESC